MSTELTEETEADFESHHIEGYVKNRYLRVPLISQITDRLWTGGCINDTNLPSTIKYVVSLYPWEQYKLAPATERIEVKMYDHGSMPDLKLLNALADMAHDLVQDSSVLIHCQAGLNRSGLLGALTLMRGGLSGREAIDLLREKRSDLVLCNATFEQYILDLDDQDS